MDSNWKNYWKNNWKKICNSILFLIPLIAGTAGYLTSGKKITDALYAGVALYGISPVASDYNTLIEIARWTAPLAAGAFILQIIKSARDNIRWRVTLLTADDSVAVYSDEKLNIEFEKGIGAIYPGKEFKGYAKSHMILFSSDSESLKFYKDHENELLQKKVYLGLRELESGLLKEIRNVRVFDINGSIARLLWKKIALWDKDEKTLKKEFNIVIYGNDPLAQQILSVGLQQYLYSQNQRIRYHFISDNPSFQIRHKDINLMNEDKICYYKTSDSEIWNIVSQADIVILTQKENLDLLQTMAVRANNGTIYYYSPKEGDAADYVSFGNSSSENMIPFGREKEIFKDENIRQSDLVKSAIELNGRYMGIISKTERKKEWNKLNGFLKASNISAADYGQIMKKLADKPSQGRITEEELAKLEHIRWCRFHFLNYWKYGIPEDGKNKDEAKRIHKDLMEYGDLSPEEKEKDRENVRMFLKQNESREDGSCIFVKGKINEIRIKQI